MVRSAVLTELTLAISCSTSVVYASQTFLLFWLASLLVLVELMGLQVEQHCNCIDTVTIEFDFGIDTEF